MHGTGTLLVPCQRHHCCATLGKLLNVPGPVFFSKEKDGDGREGRGKERRGGKGRRGERRGGKERVRRGGR